MPSLGLLTLCPDIVGYTNLSQSVEPEEVMMMLHQLYTKYDALCNTHGVYKGTAGACKGEVVQPVPCSFAVVRPLAEDTL